MVGLVSNHYLAPFAKKNSIALSIFLRILKVFWLSNDGIRTQDAFRIRAR